MSKITDIICKISGIIFGMSIMFMTCNRLFGESNLSWWIIFSPLLVPLFFYIFVIFLHKLYNLWQMLKPEINMEWYMKNII